MVVSGHRKDCPPVWWSEGYVLIYASSVTCAQKLGTCSSSWLSLGTSEKREVGVSPERQVGHTLVSAEMGLGNRQLNPIIDPLSSCYLLY